MDQKFKDDYGNERYGEVHPGAGNYNYHYDSNLKKDIIAHVKQPEDNTSHIDILGGFIDGIKSEMAGYQKINEDSFRQGSAILGFLFKLLFVTIKWTWPLILAVIIGWIGIEDYIKLFSGGIGVLLYGIFLSPVFVMGTFLIVVALVILHFYKKYLGFLFRNM